MRVANPIEAARLDGSKRTSFPILLVSHHPLCEHTVVKCEAWWGQTGGQRQHEVLREEAWVGPNTNAGIALISASQEHWSLTSTIASRT